MNWKDIPACDHGWKTHSHKQTSSAIQAFAAMTSGEFAMTDEEGDTATDDTPGSEETDERHDSLTDDRSQQPSGKNTATESQEEKEAKTHHEAPGLSGTADEGCGPSMTPQTECSMTHFGSSRLLDIANLTMRSSNRFRSIAPSKVVMVRTLRISAKGVRSMDHGVDRMARRSCYSASISGSPTKA